MPLYCLYNTDIVAPQNKTPCIMLDKILLQRKKREGKSFILNATEHSGDRPPYVPKILASLTCAQKSSE